MIHDSGVAMEWVEGYGWVVVLGLQRKEDVAAAEVDCEILATSRRMRQKRRDSGLPGAAIVRIDETHDPSAAKLPAPVVTGGIELRESRRRRA